MVPTKSVDCNDCNKVAISCEKKELPGTDDRRSLVARCRRRDDTDADADADAVVVVWVVRVGWCCCTGGCCCCCGCCTVVICVGRNALAVGVRSALASSSGVVVL